MSFNIMSYIYLFFLSDNYVNLNYAFLVIFPLKFNAKFYSTSQKKRLN